MRIDSFSIREINSFVFSPSGTAPCRCSSANPRIAVKGVRSSWLASATKRRNLSSLCMRASKASSIRESIVLREVLKRPTSVSGSKLSRRADKSPAAIFSAVSSIFSNGRIPTLITCRDAKAIKSKTKLPMIKNTEPICRVVLS